MSLEQKRDWIKEKLRRFPYWRGGHERLAQVARDLGDMNLARVSELAGEELSRPL